MFTLIFLFTSFYFILHDIILYYSISFHIIVFYVKFCLFPNIFDTKSENFFLLIKIIFFYHKILQQKQLLTFKFYNNVEITKANIDFYVYFLPF